MSDWSGKAFFLPLHKNISMSSLETNRVQFEAALLVLLEGLNTGTGGDGSTILPARLSLINYVKAKLDELIPEGEGISFKLSATPNISDPLDLLINAHLDEATKDIILAAPLSVLFPTKASATAGTTFTDTKTGYVELPANFVRLSSFKMTDWKKDISIPITPENVAYSLQQFPLRRGSINFPVAVLNWKTISAASKRILEYYSVLTLHTIEKFLYIPEQAAQDFVVVNPNLLDSLAWQCAGKIMQITGMLDAAKLAQDRVVQSFNYRP